jgi:hypothetical protein
MRSRLRLTSGGGARFVIDRKTLDRPTALLDVGRDMQALDCRK